jgi:UDP-glucose 4-epimerase
MSRPTVLITGAGGFLGGHVARHLAAEGYEVVLWSGSRNADLPAAARVYPVRLPDSSCEAILRREQPASLIHCAGTSRVDRSFTDPAADFRDNLLATECVLAGLAAQSPKTQFVFISSAAVYGNPARLPITEATGVGPISPYGFHKLMCELSCRKYHRLRGISIAILRVFSAYGPGLAKQVLWDIARKSRESGVISLDGTGDERRDFVHVADVAKIVAGVVAGVVACRRGLTPPLAAEDVTVLNVASGRSIAIRELAARFLTVLGRPRGVVFSGRVRSGSPERWEVDIAALERLGLAPRTPLEAGLGEYARWVNEQQEPRDASRFLAAPG